MYKPGDKVKYKGNQNCNCGCGLEPGNIFTVKDNHSDWVRAYYTSDWNCINLEHKDIELVNLQKKEDTKFTLNSFRKDSWIYKGNRK